MNALMHECFNKLLNTHLCNQGHRT